MAELADLIVGVIVLLACALCAVVVLVMFEAIASNPQFQEVADNNTVGIMAQTTSTFYMWDYAGVFLFFGIMIVSIMSGALVRSHPMFFVFSLLYMVVWASISSIFTVLYVDLMSNVALSTIAASFTWTLLTFQYLPFIGLVLMGIAAVATHGKT